MKKPFIIVGACLLCAACLLSAACAQSGGGSGAASVPAAESSVPAGRRTTGAAVPLVPPAVTAEARAIAAAMTVEQKCAQTMMVSFGIRTSLPPEFLETARKVPAGGVLLLGYNIAEKAEGVIALTSSLLSLSRETGAGVPVFIAVDHEGGTVYRLGRSATRLPDASAVGEAWAAGTDRELIAALYRSAARQLHSLGISMNLAPILEPLNAENRDFLRFRSFSVDPEIAAEAGGLVVDAMRDGGILAVGKHFPGSGDGDPHTGLPVFGFDITSPGHPQILPFRRAVEEHRIGAIMTSHAAAPSLDPGLPVTLSPRVQTALLRDTLGFQGIVLTDDINMRAVVSGRDSKEAAVTALAAGADMIMYLGEDYADVHAALVRAARDGGLSGERLDQAVIRILEQKIALGLWDRPEEPAAGKAADTAQLLKKEGDELLGRFKNSRKQ